MSIFITSDLHLNHSRIINYCNRPFKNVNHMNFVLVNNWNNTVGYDDKVYFLGDLSFQTEHWIPSLNGEIIFIRGNHDRFRYTRYYNNSVLKYRGELYYLVHDPFHVPKDWKGWVIHGHTHNYEPFFDKTKKSFNISTDVTYFKPVNMEYISYLAKGIRYGKIY